ncbi:hypothetical protein SESBI_18391 [Sesbania bispinosa]|nr:hypothetical protein SESBI_18391 [Sesbania bispinosa]
MQSLTNHHPSSTLHLTLCLSQSIVPLFTAALDSLTSVVHHYCRCSPPLSPQTCVHLCSRHAHVFSSVPAGHLPLPLRLLP